MQSKMPLIRQDAVEYPRRAIFWVVEMTVIQGTWTTAGGSFSAAWNNTVKYNYASGVPPIGDSFAFSFMLTAGKYRMNLMSYVGANMGQLFLSVDGFPVAAFDMAGGGVYNVTQSSIFDCAGSGRHVLVAKVGAGSNGATYYAFLSKLWITPADGDESRGS